MGGHRRIDLGAFRLDADTAELSKVDRRIAQARRILENLDENAGRDYLKPQAFATVHPGLGEPDQAFCGLEQAYQARAFELRAFTKGFVEFMSDEPGFQDLLDRRVWRVSRNSNARA